MKLDFEYGQGLMSAELPDSTDIFIPGETVPDPPWSAPRLGQPVCCHPGVYPAPHRHEASAGVGWPRQDSGLRHS